MDICIGCYSEIPSSFIKENGFYANIRYYYAHSYLLLLKLLGVRIYLNDKISTKRTLWISNHRSKLDGLVIQSVLCAGKNDTFVVVKKSISYLPIFGSFGKHVDCIYVGRDNAFNDSNIISLSAKKSLDMNKSVLIFPEGTTLSDKSKKKSDSYAIKNNICLSGNTLIPRTTGFRILKANGKFDHLGDITIRYNNPAIYGITGHSYLDLFNVFPKEIYLDINYSDINYSDTESDNLVDLFAKKDEKLNKSINYENYSITCPYSIGCLLLNFTIFVIFYSGFLILPYFFYMTLIISLYSTIKMWFW
jgi:lysocardiolipin and lysophospholipid acyltransferase